MARPARCCGGNTSIPAPGEPGSETWKDNNNAWQTGGGAFYVTGSYDPATNHLWGSGNPVPMYDPYYRPGDNLYTNSLIAFDPATGKMNWYHQYTPSDIWDYDETGSHILIDAKIGGEPPSWSRIRRATVSLFLRPHQRADPDGKALYGRRSPGPRASTKRPAGRSNTIRLRISRSIPAGRP